MIVAPHVTSNKDNQNVALKINRLPTQTGDDDEYGNVSGDGMQLTAADSVTRREKVSKSVSFSDSLSPHKSLDMGKGSESVSQRQPVSQL